MNLKKYKILLIEDNDDHFAMIDRFVGEGSQFGYHFDRSSRLKDGLKKLAAAENEFDIILLDLSLPDSDFTQTLSEMAKCKTKLPIIVMTEIDDIDLAMKMLQEGAQDYLVKSKMNSDALNRSIRYAVERKILENRLQEVSDKRDQKNQTLEVLVEEKTRSLRESERLYHTLLRHAPVGIVMIDKNNKITFANNYFESIFLKLDNKETLLKDVFGERSYKALLKNMGAEIAKEGSFRKRIRCLNKDGDTLYCNITVVGIQEFEMTLNRHLLVIEDISDKVRQEQLESEKLTALAQNKAKTDFLAFMSHEIRTPLSAISGYSNLLIDEASALPDSLRKHISSITRNSDHLMSLVNDLLDLSKIEAGQLDVNLKPIKLAEEVEKVLSIVEPSAKGKGIALDVEAKSEVPVEFRSDPQKLRQILVNLLGNAIKYTDKGTVRLIVKFSQSGKKPRLIFLIVDSGYGIDKNLQKRLFIPFSRGQEDKVFSKDGVGLGLPLSKSLAEKLGGTVKLSKSGSNGSIFKFSLDLEEASFRSGLLEINKLSESGYPRRTLKEKIGDKLVGLNILLAEDVESIRELIIKYLRIAGANVTACSNGQEALQQALRGNADVVLLDIQMPILTGTEVAETLRKSQYLKPIIALTAHALNHEREEGLKRGFDFFLTKPIDPDSLIDTIRVANKKSKCRGNDSIVPIVSIFEHDEAVIETIPLFIDHLRETTKKLGQMIEADGWTEIAKSAHQLKGSAGSYGYPTLAEAAYKLEQEAKNTPRPPLAKSLVHEIVTLAGRIEAGLSATHA